MNVLVSPVETLVDRDSFEPVADDLASRDPLAFEGYRAALDEKRSGGLDESVTYGAATIGGTDVEVAAFDFGFFGGSMGEVAGERIARSIERAIARDVPLILRTATGGARMQEGMRSLIQMPKVVAARIELGHAGLPLIAVLGHPTTGGVLASIGALADMTVAESGATIGFAGPRVSERFTGEPLPEGSHTATSAYGSGLVDEIVTTSDAHAYVAGVLKILAPDDPREVDSPPSVDGDDDLDAWELTESVRNNAHPRAPQLVMDSADQLVYLRGDRAGANDDAVVAGIARVAGRRCLFLAHDRDHHPGPAAYRKARRALEVAARLRLPVVTLVDTKGADPSASSEAGGIAWEIARLFEAMLSFPGPIVAIVTGEGGSGGALAFAAGDRLIAFRRSIFSVIGPEGAAEILWRDADLAPKAARALKLTAADLHELGIADELVDAPASPESLRHVIATGLDATEGGNSKSRRERWRTR